MPRLRDKLRQTNYNSLILKRAQKENFVGLAPTIDRIRKEAGKGGLWWQIDNKRLPEGGWAKRTPGTFDINQAMPMIRTGTFPIIKGRRVGMYDAYGKANLNNFLRWASKNRKFSTQARGSFKWALDHTIPTYNLGEIYDKYGVKGGKKFLEKEFGQTSDKWWFRHQYSAQSKAVYSPDIMSKMSERERMAFLGRNKKAIYPEAYREQVKKVASRHTKEAISRKEALEKGYITKGEYRDWNKISGRREAEVAARFFQSDIAVSKGMDFSHEYRVVYAGGEAVDITHRWASPGVKKTFDKYPFMKKTFRKLGIESGYPELMIPVFGHESKVLKKFTRELAPSFPQASGAFDIGRQSGRGLDVNSLKMIEQQVHYGNLAQPWVRSRVAERLYGKVPMIKKVARGALVAGGIAADCRTSSWKS